MRHPSQHVLPTLWTRFRLGPVWLRTHGRPLAAKCQHITNWKAQMPVPKRFKQHTESNRGEWSNWVMPKPESYFFKCCDCGLVHEMQFKTFAESDQKRGAFRINILPWPIRAMFRARRAR